MSGAAVLFCVMGIGRFGLTPILPAMIDAGLVDHFRAGLLASANFLGYLAGALLLWRFPGPLTHSRWFVVSLAASVIATGAMAFFPAFSVQIPLRFAGGLASTVAMALASGIVFSRCKSYPVAGSAIFFGGVGCGIAFSAVLVELMQSWGSDWRGLWLGLAAASTLPAWLAGRHLAPHLDDTAPPSAPDEPGRSQELGPLMIAFFLFGYGYVITSTFLVAQIRSTPALSNLEMESWLLVGLAGVPAAGLWYAFAKRSGFATAFAAACFAEAIGIACSVTGTSAEAILISAFIFGFTFMGISPLGLLYAAAIGQSGTSRVIGMMSATFGLGQVIGPVVAGHLIAANGNYFVAVVSGALALLLAAILTAPAAIRERTRRRGRAPFAE
ncbi:YbfB/YjiJ family MFS transporter [Roseovarius sp.]|uniref:YbfB/YjiJ family MFS transporter n=1 Tax=Roseovarius sp. TaxID=1486281 RepID=UPI003A97B6FE